MATHADQVRRQQLASGDPLPFYSPADQQQLGITGFLADGTPTYGAPRPGPGAPMPEPSQGAIDAGVTGAPMGVAMAGDEVDLDVPYEPDPYGEEGGTSVPGGGTQGAVAGGTQGAVAGGTQGAVAGGTAGAPGAVSPEGDMGGPDSPIQGEVEEGGQYEPNLMSSALGGLASMDTRGLYGAWIGAAGAGIAKGVGSWQQQMAAMRGNLNKPSSVKEYEYAKGEGFRGNFTDYKKEFGGNQFQQMMQMMQYRGAQGARQDTQDYRTRQEERASEERAYTRGQDTQAREQAAVARERKQRMGAVPSGYERIENTGDGSYFDRPSIGSKDFVKAEEKTQVLYQGIGNINKMVDLVEEFGSESYGQNSTRMSSLYGDIIAVVAEAQNKGVIQAGEMEMIEKGITDPGDWKSHRKSNKAIISGYKQVADQLETKMKGMRAKYKRWGYEMPVDPALVPGDDGIIDL